MNFLILAMLRRWQNADLYVWFICLSIDNSLSNKTSVFFADSDSLITAHPKRVEFNVYR